jgi:uncharacterized membrane protein YfcA
MHASTSDLILLAVAFAAALVNGGLGYGFSSLTVPVALLSYAGRVLNPALVVLELFINAASLLVNRRGLPAVLPRIWPLLLGALPGSAAGSLVLAAVAPGNLKLFTFAALLPLLVAQSVGWRRPIRNERALGLPIGIGLGALYGATTVSGPPLALLFNNQGLSKDEFRAALAAFRIVESSCTLAAYLALGLVGTESLRLGGWLAPAVLVGVPAGYLLMRRVAAQAFRSVCIGVDVVLVAFALSRSLTSRGLLAGPAAWALLAALAALEVALVVRHLASAPRQRARAETPPSPSPAPVPMSTHVLQKEVLP